MNTVNWNLTSDPVQRSEWIEHAVESAQTYLDNVRKYLAEMGIQAQTLIKPGAVAQTLLETADEEQVDLIGHVHPWALGLGSVSTGKRSRPGGALCQGASVTDAA